MRRRRARAGVLTAALLLPVAATASDHADPLALTTLEAGITGLFAFPKGEDLVVVLTVRRGLTSPAPYPLDEYEYKIFMDLTSKVLFGNAEDVARYGGTVKEPEGIAHDVAIRFRLDDNARLQEGFPDYAGKTTLAHYERFPVAVGVYDDPFIFPRFFEKNVIAMAVSIPFSSFPGNQQDMLLWATTTKNGKLIDHVGRSNRTQLGRLDFLNTLHPSEHVAAIDKRHERGNSLQSGLSHLMGHFLPVGGISGLFTYVLQVRDYDNHPDVMIFTTRRPAGFPNGRRLEDDVAGLTCAQGDCVLQEVAFIEGEWPRATVNDRAFSDEFPYLGAPWPERAEERRVDRCALVFWLIVLAVVVIWIWVMRRRARADLVPYVRPYRDRE